MPAFFLSGTPQSAWALGPFLLVAALFHFQLNGPAWPDAQPWDSIILSALAVIVVVLNRKDMFARDAGVTDVLASHRGNGPDRGL